MKKKIVITSLLLFAGMSAFSQKLCVLVATDKTSGSFNKVKFQPIKVSSKETIQIPDSCESLSQGLNYMTSQGWKLFSTASYEMTGMGTSVPVLVYTFKKD